MLKAIIFAILAIAVLAEDLKIPQSNRERLLGFFGNTCDKNGATDKATQLGNVFMGFVQCAMGYVNVETQKKEIEEATSNGTLDEVFKKYCAMAPQLKTCITTILDNVRPCVDSNLQDNIQSMRNGNDQLIDFLCYKDGDRIALFVAEEGPQCIQEKSNEIRTCLDDFSNSISILEQATAPTFKDRCDKYDVLSTCIVNKLKTCSKPTPANMIESILRYVRKSSPCDAMIPNCINCMKS